MLQLLVLATGCILGRAPMPHIAGPLDVRPLPRAPVLDGHVDTREYGPATVHLATAAGDAQVWIGRYGGFLYIAAELPDSTPYWGDDFVISLDPEGHGGPAPTVGDRQWYLRRMLDSSAVSVVTPANQGWWSAPGHVPPRLGSLRHTADWAVASTSSAAGWTIELRIREGLVKPGAAAPRLALRTYNDRPEGWWSWPAAPADLSARCVEMIPDLWAPLRFR